MNKIGFLFIISFFPLFLSWSCIGRRSAAVQDNCTLCLESELYQFLNYAAERFPHTMDMDFGSIDTCFYYSYFFQREDEYYASLWRDDYDTYLDILLKENPDKTFYYRWLKVSRYYYILIAEESSELIKLFTPCEDYLRDINDLPKPRVGMVNDGPLFARTYRINEHDNQFDFQIQDDYILDFLGEEWVEWEEYTMKLMREFYPHAKWQ